MFAILAFAAANPAVSHVYNYGVSPYRKWGYEVNQVHAAPAYGHGYGYGKGHGLGLGGLGYGLGPIGLGHGGYGHGGYGHGGYASPYYG